MSILQSIILGIIQGVTEFLPISSSAHLKIMPWLFGWTTESFNISMEAFDVALHLGTLFSILLIFHKDWIELFKAGFKQIKTKKSTPKGRLFWYIVLATIPAGILGLLFDKLIGDKIEYNIVIALALIILGIVLYIVDKKSKSKINLDKISLKQAMIIGLSQVLAFIPGVSRSGITITTARKMGIDRESAAKFTFYLATPIVAAAAILKIKDFHWTEPYFYIGVFTSFVVGCFVMKFLLKYLKKGNYKIFAIYRVIFGLIIILFDIIRIVNPS